VNLGKVEADLAAKNEAFDTMKDELTEQFAEKAEDLADMKKELELNAPKRSKRSSLTMSRMPLLQGLRRLCLRWSANTLRWASQTMPLPTTSSRGKSCQGTSLKTTNFSLFITLQLCYLICTLWRSAYTL